MKQQNCDYENIDIVVGDSDFDKATSKAQIHRRT